MKRFYILLVLFLPIGLVACATTYSQTISYGDKIMRLESQGHPYEEVFVKEIPGVYLGSSLKQAYLEVLTETGDTKVLDYFRDSLFFAQENIDIDIDLSQFVNDNIQKSFSYYEIDKEDSRSLKSFVCKSKVIPSELLEFTVVVDDENSLYFAEYFYIHAGEANIISFVSDSEHERKLFVSSMDSFRCN